MASAQEGADGHARHLPTRTARVPRASRARRSPLPPAPALQLLHSSVYGQADLKRVCRAWKHLDAMATNLVGSPTSAWPGRDGARWVPERKSQGRDVYSCHDRLFLKEIGCLLQLAARKPEPVVPYRLAPLPIGGRNLI